mmetsp:Transcript_22318/g.36704  ORF Transcript_22318/g.36704 Transcript_22318/m.36704 type:complete len:205 (+) Transcript_22318:62-676(+)
MTLMTLVLFVIVLLNCRVAAQSDGLYDRTLILRSRNLRHELAGDRHSLENNLDQPYQADIAPIIADQQIKLIGDHNDAQSTSTSSSSSSRNLQTQSWRTNNNYNRNSGINSDGTTGENYWKDRISKGLRNAGIVIVIWFVVIGSIGTVCRCYLCWESILRNSFGYNSTLNGDDNYVEDADERYSNERLNGVDMPPVSSLNGHQG